MVHALICCGCKLGRDPCENDWNINEGERHLPAEVSLDASIGEFAALGIQRAPWNAQVYFVNFDSNAFYQPGKCTGRTNPPAPVTRLHLPSAHTFLKPSEHGILLLQSYPWAHRLPRAQPHGDKTHLIQRR